MCCSYYGTYYVQCDTEQSAELNTDFNKTKERKISISKHAKMVKIKCFD